MYVALSFFQSIHFSLCLEVCTCRGKEIWISGVNNTILLVMLMMMMMMITICVAICVVFITFQNDVSHFNVLRQQ